MWRNARPYNRLRDDKGWASAGATWVLDDSEGHPYPFRDDGTFGVPNPSGKNSLIAEYVEPETADAILARTSIPEAMQELRTAEARKLSIGDIEDHGDHLGRVYQEVGAMNGLPEHEHTKALDAILSLSEAAERPATIGDDYSAYAALADVLNDAYMQAAHGKGRNRHSQGKPFLEQPILEIPRMQSSIDGLTYQVMKKAQEASRMLNRGRYSAAVAELYGVINYAAAAVIRAREIETEAGNPDS